MTVRHFARWMRPMARSHERGATAVEFALLAPVFFMMSLGIIETSMIVFAQNVMESATFNASRTGKTGHVEEGQTREQTILAEIANRAGNFIDMEHVSITSQSYDNFSGIGKPEPFIDANSNGERDDGENFTDMNGNGEFDLDRGSGGSGSAQDVVVYTVSYPWELFTPMIGQLIGEDGVLDISSRLVVKNEPY